MPIKLTLFFTYGVSLEIWARTGLLKRELRIYEELIKKYNLQVQLVTYGDESDHYWVENVNGITVLPVYSKIPYRNSKILRLLQTVLIPWKFKSELADEDIYKTNQMLGGWVALLSHIFFRKPLLTRCGYEIYDAYRFQKKPRILILLIWLISWVTYKSSNAIHVATLKDKEVVKNSFGVQSSRIEIRPNWIDRDVFKSSLDRKKNNKILFVGRLNKQKNITLLLDSLAGTEVSVDIFGDGPLKADLIKYASDNLVDANFLGSLPNDQMPIVYNSYAIYVLCSPYEGNPKTLLEAMSCGCAVIGTDVPGIKSIIIHKKNGLLVEENYSSLRAAILELTSDIKLQKSLGKEAEKYIERSNSLEKAILSEIDAYIKIVDTSR